MWLRLQDREGCDCPKGYKREIVNICPSISEKSVEAAMKKLLDEGYIVKHGSGKGTFYSKKF